ncbi:MBL fold metallo-hydrolase [Actinorhabdospora filicis]|uniref:MBL fold metallo-hydrolase n=1 Tax=Actinorhabdospora filicis TaxID=1785913 RepID=A0A9W6SLZ3_9ACTN|nr:MBL fold metallo-hydrolase [Actinorhabdospora filicis]
MTLRWLGNNSWEITGGGTVILIDPWLTRFHTGTYTPEGAPPDVRIVSDPARIDPYISTAKHILVTHGHYDHLPDVPHIARRTGATVMGSETHLNLLRALGAPGDQMSLVRGGEYFQFDGYTIQVFRSTHSTQGGKLVFPGTRPASVPKKPRVIADLVEGDTLAYLITIGDVKIMNFGSSNFISREIEGLRPDVLLVQPGGGSTHDYVPRMFAALGEPRYVIPTHWDDFDEPLTAPAVDWGGLETLRASVAKASPRSSFVVVDHLERFTPR